MSNNPFGITCFQFNFLMSSLSAGLPVVNHPTFFPFSFTVMGVTDSLPVGLSYQLHWIGEHV